uniref:Uncharacterized protein n=2 Tax=Mesangiospermae TaxID=1437183 RepID=F6HS06_VITVI
MGRDTIADIITSI